MGNYEYKKYKVIEEYFGEKIEVNVSECWSSEGIESADISCSHSTIFRGLGHSIGNYRPYEYGGVIGEVIKRLSVDDVHDAIFKEIYIAEESIARSKKKLHDNFENTRHFHVIVEYEGQEIGVTLMIKAGRKEIHIICPSTYMVSSVSMEDNKFRDKIIDEVEKCKELIDNGYVFPTPSRISKVKKKVKNYFNF
jgi:hypothetical protein